MVYLVNGTLGRIPRHPRPEDAHPLPEALYEAPDEPCHQHGPYPARFLATGQCRECYLATCQPA